MILQRWLADLPPLGVIAASLGVSALVYVPITALAGPGSAPSLDALVSIVVLAVVCTAIAFLVFFALITEIGPVRATVITYVNPAVAAVLGVVVLDEAFTVGMAVGFVLVLAGSVPSRRGPGGRARWATRRCSSRRRPTADSARRELGEAPLEEAPLGVRVHELERAAVGVARLVGAVEAAQQLGARRVEVVVAVELEPLDERERAPRRRPPRRARPRGSARRPASR